MTETATGYTIAYVGDVLLAVVPDGADIRAAIADEERRANETFHDVEIESGLTLTNDRDDGKIIFSSPNGRCGQISDATGKRYDYAVAV